jgi:hypothetical protein
MKRYFKHYPKGIFNNYKIQLLDANQGATIYSEVPISGSFGVDLILIPN